MTRALTILLISCGTALAADKMVKEEASLSPTHKLALEHPERFRYDVVQQPDDGFRTALRFRSFGADGISTLSFKLLASKDDAGALKSQTEVEAAVKEMGASYVEGSVEKTNTVRRIQHKSGAAAYCHFTDADLARVVHLRPGQFRHITLGLVKVGDYVFTVRGYSNSKDGDDYKAMLTVLEGLKIEKQLTDEKPKAVL
jgi:hypothetical protein